MNNSLLWYTTRGAGMIVLMLLTAVVVMGVMSVSRPASAGWPRFLSTGLHRNLALMSLVFLGVHIVTAVVDPFTHLGWGVAVVPFSSYYRTLWLGLGTLAFDLLAAVMITSWVRNFIGYRLWRAIHWLAYASWPIGMVHALGTGTDVGSIWFLVISWACFSTVVYAVVYRLKRGSSDPLAARWGDFQVGLSWRRGQK
jgi:methionine sulfoxide reductase heme-binding subunit